MEKPIKSDDFIIEQRAGGQFDCRLDLLAEAWAPSPTDSVATAHDPHLGRRHFRVHQRQVVGLGERPQIREQHPPVDVAPGQPLVRNPSLRRSSAESLPGE